MKSVIYLFMSLLLTVFLGIHNVYASPLTFFVNLSGANEVPPTGSAATGQAIVVLDPTAQTLQLNVTFSGLGSNDVAAHIHCCLPSPFLTGVNVGVATTVPAFVGFPLGVTSGSYSSQVFDLTQALIYNPAFVTAQGGIPQAEAALIAGIETGRTYLNIHTVNFGGGEIRGFLTAPEPSSFFLLAMGLLAFGIAMHRQRARWGKQ